MQNKLFPVAILAGGLATRLRPLTDSKPKALIEVNGEPFLAHQLRLLRKQGIQDVVLCLGYLAEQIMDFIDEGNHFDLNIIYSVEGHDLLGTGGAIAQALPALGEHFFVLYGDSYLPCDYAAIQAHYLASQKLALMTVFHNQGQWDKSNIEFTNSQILQYDKENSTSAMHYIDYGVGIFNRKAFTDIPDNHPCDLATIYQDLLKKQQLAAYEANQRFYETGSFAGITELEKVLKETI